jgi:hypothetical protein
VTADLSEIDGSGICHWSAHPARKAGDRAIAGAFRSGRGHRRRTGAESVGAPLSRDGKPTRQCPGAGPASMHDV